MNIPSAIDEGRSRYCERRTTGGAVIRLRRVRAVLLGALVAAILTVIGSGTAHACSCAVQPLDLQVSTADVVFTGTPTNADKPENPTNSAAPVRWTFAVEAVHKGTVTRTVDVVSALDSASCGIPFVINKRYLVFGVTDGGTLTAGLCGGTVPVDQLPADALNSFGGTAPAANVPTPQAQDTSAAAGESTESWSGTAAITVVIGAAVILGLGLVAVWRRSHRAP